MQTMISPERRLELSHAVNRLSDAILRGDTTTDVLQSLVDIAGPTLRVDRALICDVKWSTQIAKTICEWRQAGGHDGRGRTTFPLGLFPSATREMARTFAPLESSRHDPHPLLVADGADQLLHHEMCIQRLLWYPFRQYPDGYYILVFNQVSQDRALGPDEMDFVNVVATQVNQALMKLELLREREIAEAELRESERRFRLFFDSTPSMFFMVDRGAKVRSMNQYASQHLGYAPGEVLGQSVLGVVHPEDRTEVMTHLTACFDDPGTVRELSFRKTCKDGSTMWVKETIRVVDGPDGASALIVCEDVTESRAHEQAARTAESKAESKDEFVAMLGHELRNPLAPIVTALEILRTGGRSDPELELIDRQVAHLRRLVDDLLDVARIGRGKVELQMEQIELAVVAAQAAEIARPLFHRKRQTLIVDIAPRGLMVVADPSRLVQAFANLLTNAGKFSAEGEEIYLSAERRDDRIVAGVRDHGEGIEPEMLGRVFDVFVQRPKPADRAQSGLGLGLPIARDLITLHGGTVLASSEGLGRGTVVVVDLPAAPEAPARSRRRPAAAVSRPPRDGPGPTVLVVDDNDDVRKSLCKLLGVYGYNAIGAGDAASGLVVAAEAKPRVVLVDIGLPGMDGYEFARRLRSEQPDGPPLVAITGYGQPSDQARSREAGFIAHLVKPVEFSTLLPLLEMTTAQQLAPQPA